MKLLTHNQFLEQFLRVAKDFDGGDGIQCVDLAKMYAFYVFGIKLGSFGGSALKGWLNVKNTFTGTQWIKIPNSPKNFPIRGDIIFYSDPKGTGHVAVVHEADINDVTLIEQNGDKANGLGKGYDAINFDNGKRDYKNCLGWYRKK